MYLEGEATSYRMGGREVRCLGWGTPRLSDVNGRAWGDLSLGELLDSTAWPP